MAAKRARKNREAVQDSAHVPITNVSESSSRSSEDEKKEPKNKGTTQPKTEPKTESKSSYSYRYKVCIRVPSNINSKWIKKCNLPKKTLFKYSIQEALDTSDVSAKEFGNKFKRYKTTLTDDELVNLFFRAGFG